jgi:hypothetical protein
MAHTHGVVHIFGLNGTVNNLTLQDDEFDHKFALDVEVKDEDGVVITNRLDDERNEVNLTGTMLATGSDGLMGGTLSYGGVTFIVKGVTDRGTNQDFRKVTIKGIKYQAI